MNPQLFDLKDDPGEKVNLAANNPKLVKQLSKLLERMVRTERTAIRQSRARSCASLDRKPRKRKAAAPAENRFPRPTSCCSTQTISAITRSAALVIQLCKRRTSMPTGQSRRAIRATPSSRPRPAGSVVRAFSPAATSASICIASRPDRSIRKLCESSYFAVLKRGRVIEPGTSAKNMSTSRTESAAAMFDVRRRLGRQSLFQNARKTEANATKRKFWATGESSSLKEQRKDQPFCLQLSFNATHAEDGDKRPGIGHFPWPKGNGRNVRRSRNAASPAKRDPAIYESQPDFLKRSINRQRYFWRWDTPQKYQTNMRAYFRMISGIDHVVGTPCGAT